MSTPHPDRPLVVAHRAGNDLALLRRALAAGVDVVEADLHLHRGAVEVRHTKTLGPQPLLWDRWYLADGLARPLLLEHVLEELVVAPAAPTLMLDLKGLDPRLPGEVHRRLAAWPPDRPVLACSRVWWNLRMFADHPVVVPVHSAGTPRQLAELLRRNGPGGLRGVSVHQRLLDPARVAALRERAEIVLTWPVNTPEDARRLAGWGVTGLITDDVAAVAAAV